MILMEMQRIIIIVSDMIFKNKKILLINLVIKKSPQ